MSSLFEQELWEENYSLIIEKITLDNADGSHVEKQKQSHFLSCFIIGQDPYHFPVS